MGVSAMAKKSRSRRTTGKPRLMYAASEHDSNMFYATRFWAPDPFVYVEKNGKGTILLSKLEYDRGKDEAKGLRVMSVDKYDKLAKKRLNLEESSVVGPAEIIYEYLKSQKIRSVDVPENFPFGLARDLEKRGIRVTPGEEPFIPSRERKTEEEIRWMSKALRNTECGFVRAMEVLGQAKVSKSNRLLKWNGKTLTSEILRGEIEAAVARAGAVASGTIVAGGQDAVDPHNRGSGPLRANELIILDIFPRDTKTGYYGDMTRTVLKGKASEAQKQMWDTVLEAEKRAFRAMKPGIHGKTVYEGTVEFFKECGYETKKHKGRNVGFYHGLGHGLGLDVHELLRIRLTDPLEPGQVFTVEPGLYYPEIGGCRHEDVGVVTDKGFRVLSRFPKSLEIR